MSVLDHISKAELKALSRKSDVRATWMAASNFALVALGFALPIAWPHALGWIAGALLLGARALALGILVHDAAHHALFTSRRVNEWSGKWLFGALPNVPYQAYRDGHLAHHRLAGTGDDPDLAFVDGFPATRASLLRKFVRDVSGLNGLRNIAYQWRSFGLAAQLPFVLAHVVVFAALWAFGHPAVYACWWLGQVFVFPLAIRLRVMGEHGGVPDHVSSDPRDNTATTLAGPVARLLFAPNFVNFHLEHHFASGVPSYRLREMHRLLVAKGCYAGRDCVAPSYLAVIRRCLWTPASGTPAPSRERARQRAKGALSNMQ